MTIQLNPNKAVVADIRAKLKENNGYCPCALIKTPETKCICQDFLNQTSGKCHCGLYIKTED